MAKRNCPLEARVSNWMHILVFFQDSLRSDEKISAGSRSHQGQSHPSAAGSGMHHVSPHWWWQWCTRAVLCVSWFPLVWCALHRSCVTAQRSHQLRCKFTQALPAKLENCTFLFSYSLLLLFGELCSSFWKSLNYAKVKGGPSLRTSFVTKSSV